MKLKQTLVVEKETEPGSPKASLFSRGYFVKKGMAKQEDHTLRETHVWQALWEGTRLQKT
jgi:hypothetical protein